MRPASRLLIALRKSCARRVMRNLRLFLVTFRDSPSTCVACPVAAYGGSISPWYYMLSYFLVHMHRIHLLSSAKEIHIVFHHILTAIIVLIY